jgi:glycine/D-amino acid oxidase-like deaminating enzyme
MSKDASGGHLLRTAKGELRATSVLVATNGYSSEDLPQWLGGRFLPVQSSIFVTRPINDNELKAQGWTTRQMCYDSRHLLHYFRLLPDNRMLFGLRGGSRTTPKHETETHAQARRDFERMFPALSYIEAEYAWSGLVCMARDLTPFAGPVPGLDGVWAALCYHGNGVAMASYTGAMVAGQILGRANKTPSVMSRRLRRFELGRQRRALLPLASAWYKIQDRLG